MSFVERAHLLAKLSQRKSGADLLAFMLRQGTGQHHGYW